MIYQYLGREIYRCERAQGIHAGKWIVQAYHEYTSLPLADELCAHYWSLAQARAADPRKPKGTWPDSPELSKSLLVG